MSQKQYAYFSAAMKEGILLGRQTFDRWGGSHGSACALGSGLRAIGRSRVGGISMLGILQAVSLHARSTQRRLSC